MDLQKLFRKNYKAQWEAASAEEEGKGEVEGVLR